MYVVFRVVETGDIECHQMSHWISHRDGVDVWTLDEDMIEYRGGKWFYLKYEVEILEMVPDFRRFKR